MKKGFSARSPHHFRTFSAPSPLICSGKGAENVQKWCGKRMEYLPMVWEWPLIDPRIIKRLNQFNENNA